MGKEYDVLNEATFGEDWEKEVRAMGPDDLIEAFRRTGREVHRLDNMSQTLIGEKMAWSGELSVEKGKVAHLEGEVEQVTAQRNEAIDAKVDFQMRLSDSRASNKSLNQQLVDASNNSVQLRGQINGARISHDELQEKIDSLAECLEGIREELKVAQAKGSQE